LEQQCSELPVGDSQQQRARQPQQQPGLPPLQLTATAREGNGPMRWVHGPIASTNALTIAPDLLRRTPDKHSPPGGY